MKSALAVLVGLLILAAYLALNSRRHRRIREADLRAAREANMTLEERARMVG